VEPVESQTAAQQVLEAALAKATVGGSSSMDALLQLVYSELREMAQARLRHEPAGLTLQTTALVHEAYLKLLPRREGTWGGREHFLAAAGEAMRRILVDHARGRHRLKRGGDMVRVELNDAAMLRDNRELIELDDALERLKAIDPLGANIVTLKMFSGMTEAEIAAASATSERTVRRHWVFARAWLVRELRGEDGGESERER
jgi:RNA polymerase sigma factor (TIGR02999 family)